MLDPYDIWNFNMELKKRFQLLDTLKLCGGLSWGLIGCLPLCFFSDMPLFLRVGIPIALAVVMCVGVTASTRLDELESLSSN